MRVTVRLPEFLRRYAGGGREVPAAGSTVGDALGDLVRLHPDLGVRLLDRGGALASHLVAFRNGTSLPREGLMATVLGDGDVLEIHAAASGG
jgi:molybdopterin converting factor small subunit